MPLDHEVSFEYFPTHISYFSFFGREVDFFYTPPIPYPNANLRQITYSPTNLVTRFQYQAVSRPLNTGFRTNFRVTDVENLADGRVYNQRSYRYSRAHFASGRAYYTSVENSEGTTIVHHFNIRNSKTSRVIYRGGVRMNAILFSDFWHDVMPRTIEHRAYNPTDSD